MAVRATGLVTRIYPTRSASDVGYTYIRLDIPTDQQPREGYFQLLNDHPSYSALYSLALAAAVNRLPLTIRTVSDITPTAYAVILYMVVEWPSD
jgi:hypothetical protein